MLKVVFTGSTDLQAEVQYRKPCLKRYKLVGGLLADWRLTIRYSTGREY